MSKSKRQMIDTIAVNSKVAALIYKDVDLGFEVYKLELVDAEGKTIKETQAWSMHGIKQRLRTILRNTEKLKAS